MEDGIRLAGHPLHTILVHFPIGLCLGSVAADLVAAGLGHPSWYAAGHWMLVLGLVSSVPAALVGFVDYAALMRRRADELGETATMHMFAAITGVGCFVGSWTARGPEPLASNTYLSIGLSVLGAVAFVVAGRLGGSLVFDHGVGIRRDRE